MGNINISSDSTANILAFPKKETTYQLSLIDSIGCEIVRKLKVHSGSHFGPISKIPDLHSDLFHPPKFH